MPGKATSTPTVMMSATKNGQMPLKTSSSGISGRTPLTTKQLRPMGGVTRQTSTIFTMMMPNQTGS